MTTPQSNADEISAVNLADEFADTALMLRKSTDAEAIVSALLSLGAQVAALRETLNRELPDIGTAIYDAARETRLAGQD
jgi:hypothetical protein